MLHECFTADRSKFIWWTLCIVKGACVLNDSLSVVTRSDSETQVLTRFVINMDRTVSEFSRVFISEVLELIIEQQTFFPRDWNRN